MYEDWARPPARDLSRKIKNSSPRFAQLMNDKIVDILLSQQIFLSNHHGKSDKNSELKFIYSEKATKFCEILTLLLWPSQNI